MNKWLWVVGVLVVCVLAGLLLYSSPEEKSKKAYEQAVVVERTADDERAMALYDLIITDYPGTEGAALAEKGILRIVDTRERAFKQAARDQVARILLALNGYQSMYGTLPASISALDDGEYFFDSEYLGGMIPKPYTTYLVLSADAPLRIWPFHSEKDAVYTSIDQKGSLKKMSKAEALQEIEAGYTEVARKGQMVFLQRKS